MKPRSEKFYIKRAVIMWPSLFSPRCAPGEDVPKYCASFLLPDDLALPGWVTVRDTDGQYNLPANRRYINTRSQLPAAVFGVEESIFRAAAQTMLRVDKLIDRAEVDAVVEAWEGTSGRVFMVTKAVRVLTPVTVPDFDSFLGGLKC